VDWSNPGLNLVSPCVLMFFMFCACVVCACLLGRSPDLLVQVFMVAGYTCSHLLTSPGGLGNKSI
jgi:hypothetical protein